ncbi:MAG: RNA 2',3'-cyclic phosphodiesterase [Betaproteobacteria bacterium]|nr:RNA 2',3'-cyclic phosphodiesterase [Betaproteobacteria bacterium]
MESDTARLFFAVWPAPEIQRALGDLAQALRRDCGGRALPARNIHLTLVFLGNVGRDRLSRIEEIAAAVTAPCFDLSLERVEYWRHNRIVWAGVERCPEALAALVARLAQALTPEGFRFDERPYVPHITLLRDARRPPRVATVPAIAWPVAMFALVESVPRERGRVYEVVREWPLTA